MRTEVRIRFDGNDIPGGAEAVLRRARCGSDMASVKDVPVIGQTVVWVTLDITDERLAILLDLLRQHEVPWLEQREDRFTEEELNHARLLVMWPNDSDLTVWGGPRVGTQYDMKEACAACGALARQTSAMMIDGSDVAKLRRQRVTSTFYHDILVNERLAKELEEIGVKGLSFENVMAAKKDGSRTELPFRQLRAARTMFPMAVVSTGIRRGQPCVRCTRSCYTTFQKEPPRPAYRVKDVADIDDVMTTWEWFGYVKFNGNLTESVLPYPWFLVTPKVMRAIRASGTPAFHWIPVRIVDED